MRDSDILLTEAVSNLDSKSIHKAIANGANPNGLDPNESILHSLAYEYALRKTSAGDRILLIVETLLKSGADPNLVGYNNWRAIDISLDNGHTKFADLLIRYGAIPEMRKFT